MSESLGRLTRLGFSSLAECLLCAPKEFLDFLEPIHLLPIPDQQQKHYLVLTLTAQELLDKQGLAVHDWNKAHRLNMRAVDGRGEGITITVFGTVRDWTHLVPGDSLHIYAEVVTWKGRRQINSPELIPEDQRGRICPIYAGKPGQVKATSVSEAVAKALPQIDLAACLLLEQLGMRESDFRDFTGLGDPVDLLRHLHQPPSMALAERALVLAKRLSIKAILNRAERNQARYPVAGSLIAINRQTVAELIDRVPFPLTGDQHQAITEIISDLRSPFPMRRLLSGDVGTGKSLTFMVPAVAAFTAGAKVAIIAPNQLLVPQIANEMRGYFPEVPVTEVVSGSRVGDGIIVGTTAVLAQAAKHGLVFDLVVIDEQQKMSVGQKQALLSDHTNFLEATATAIPRTLALVQFGGMALSILRECPVKKEIVSRTVPKQERARLFDFLNTVIGRGGQVAIVYPLAEDKGDGERASVEAAFERFRTRMTGRVGMLHGKMSGEEKNAVIDRMKAGELDVLISSTVIEVGITLPSLRAVVIVHPERFDTSQMHQLRGRLARKGGKGYFFMYTPEDIEDTARERLQLMVECQDGFTLAERDADLRGFGNVDGDSGEQTGATRILFWGIDLSRHDIEAGNKALIKEAQPAPELAA
ncbi:DEAD/DEAH box helicase [Noviherbaspirillum sp. DKR-6]|uniref:DEAD/DEAH box helicase n=2 Tax=Noviherbaspirillum pedocola TaxID=2801341 RepID=A0A934SZD6_9BURK|nr:DEAD/DEAH box helicase [Noviherbaspirillum pedocola]